MYIVLHTQCKQKTCSGVTHTCRAGSRNTPKPKPLSLLPINTSRVISYNTLTMTFVTTFNCNTVDNIYVKICRLLGTQNGHSYLVNKYSSNLKMTHVSKHVAINSKHNCCLFIVVLTEIYVITYDKCSLLILPSNSDSVKGPIHPKGPHTP